MKPLKICVKNFLILSLLTVTAFTCDDFKNSDENMYIPYISSNNCQKIVLNDHGINVSSDPFSIEEVYIEGNCMKINVTHGGGCGEAFFQLFQASGIMESHPPQMNLYLELKDHDSCEALIFKELSFDLSNLPLPYNTGTIRFNLHGNQTPIDYTY